MTLITGSAGYIGSKLDIKAQRMTHQDCELTDWESVKNYKWEGDTIIHCAHSGKYGTNKEGEIEENIKMFVNMRRRWPKAKIIAFGSGAMHDKTKAIRGASAYDVAYPTDNYGLSKRLTVDLADVTLIIYGIYGDHGFIKACRSGDVTIYQNCIFSWVKEENLIKGVEWAMDRKGRFNLIDFNMSLVDIAKLEKTNYKLLAGGWANEYTGQITIR